MSGLLRIPLASLPAPQTGDQNEISSLYELIDECCRSGVARSALLLTARKMPPHLIKPHHLRLAFEALEPLRHADRARSFDLADGSRAITWRGEAGSLLDRALTTLRHLLADDPAIADIAQIAPLYVLPRDADIMREALRATIPTAPEIILVSPRIPEKLDPASLQSLEQSLLQVNVSRFARHRRVWRVADNKKLEPAWDKRFLSVAELTATLLPNHDATADAWLYRRLTRTLDRRLLSLLAAPHELRAAGPLSLDLNIGTLLTPQFLHFDSALPAHLRGNLNIDLLPADILADPTAYIFARGFARARRYQVMIREVSLPLLLALDFKALDADLIELEFTPELMQHTELLPRGVRLVLSYSNHSGQIDSAAREFAAAHGIRLLAPRD